MSKVSSADLAYLYSTDEDALDLDTIAQEWLDVGQLCLVPPSPSPPPSHTHTHPHTPHLLSTAVAATPLPLPFCAAAVGSTAAAL